MVQIEKNIPLPRSRGNASGSSRYPWAEMIVGDSFFVDGAKHPSMSAQASVAGKKHRMKFSARKEASGVRVWRVA